MMTLLSDKEEDVLDEEGDSSCSWLWPPTINTVTWFSAPPITTLMSLIALLSSSPSSSLPSGSYGAGKWGRREVAFYFSFRRRLEGHIYCRRKMKQIKGGKGRLVEVMSG